MAQRMAYCADDTAGNYVKLLPEKGSQRCVCLAQSRSMLGAIGPGLHACD